MSHSSLSFKDITHQIVPIPSITSNLDIPALERILKHAGTNHGMSLVAITMLDDGCRNLEMKMIFNDEILLGTAVSQLIDIWSVYHPIPSYIRSYRRDDVYIDNLNEQPLYANSNVPTSSADYNGKRAIIDIETKGSTDYMFKIYRLGEIKPRELSLMLKN